MAYTLNPRQQRRYTRTGDIWRPSVAITDGEPQNTVYTLVSSRVPWGAIYTPNIDQPSDFGTFKTFSDLVLDGICLHSAVDIEDNDVLVDTTLLTDGSRSKVYGSGARLRGESQLIEKTITGRDTSKQNFKAMSIDKLPPAIASAYS